MTLFNNVIWIHGTRSSDSQNLYMVCKYTQITLLGLWNLVIPWATNNVKFCSLGNSLKIHLGPDLEVESNVMGLSMRDSCVVELEVFKYPFLRYKGP